MVGYAFGQAGIRAFYWTPKRGMRQLPGLGAAPLHTEAKAINDDGRIVGVRTAADGTLHAILWIRD